MLSIVDVNCILKIVGQNVFLLRNFKHFIKSNFLAKIGNF